VGKSRAFDFEKAMLIQRGYSAKVSEKGFAESGEPE